MRDPNSAVIQASKKDRDKDEGESVLGERIGREKKTRRTVNSSSNPDLIHASQDIHSISLVAEL